MLLQRFYHSVFLYHFVEEFKDIFLEGNTFGLQELFLIIRKTQSIVIIHCQGEPAKTESVFVSVS